MNCPLCQSTNTTFLQNFIPYKDKCWKFPVYDCENCLSRFALRDEDIDYHELLHAEQGQSTYQSHYKLAEKVAGFIEKKDLKACESYLRKNSFMHGAIIDFIEMQPKKQIKVLEMGCSSGYFTAFLNARGIETFGTDISKTAIRQAKKIFPEYKSRFAASPEHSSYDVVFHKGLISCVSDPVGFLGYNIQLLRPGGKLIFNMSSVNSARKLGEVWASTPPPDVIYLFHDQVLEYLIANSRQHKIALTKHRDYFLLFKKYVSLYMHETFNKYPRPFHAIRKTASKSFLVNSIVKIIALMMRLLVKIGLITIIDEDFGTIIKLTKHEHSG